jgi:hypothetical protein
MSAKHMTKRGGNLRWFHMAALTAAMVAIILVAAGASLWHIDAPGTEATCPICHVAHMSVLPGVPTAVLATPTLIAWLVPPETRVSHAAPAGLDSPPRAPPA